MPSLHCLIHPGELVQIISSHSVTEGRTLNFPHDPDSYKTLWVKSVQNKVCFSVVEKLCCLIEDVY